MIRKINLQLVNDNDSDAIYGAIKTLLPNVVVNVQSVNFPQKWVHDIYIEFDND